MLKRINWANVAFIVGVSTLTVLFIVPFVRPLVQKFPVIGKYAA